MLGSSSFRPSTFWFVIGLILIALAAMFAPKLAGGIVILLALVLAIEANKQGLTSTGV